MRAAVLLMAPIAGLIVLALAMPAAAQDEFAAVPTGHWAYPYCDQLARDGLLLPSEWAQHQPGMTRGQFAILVSRALERAGTADAASGAGGPEGQADASVLSLLAGEFGTELQRLGWSRERVTESIASLSTPIAEPPPAAGAAPAGATPMALAQPGAPGRLQAQGASAQFSLPNVGAASLSLATTPPGASDRDPAYLPGVGADLSLNLGRLNLAAGYFRSLGPFSRTEDTAGPRPGVVNIVSYSVARALSITDTYRRGAAPRPQMAEEPREAAVEGLGGGVRLNLAGGSALSAGFERYRGMGANEDLVLTRILAQANMALSERFRLAFDLELRRLAGGAPNEDSLRSGVSLDYSLSDDAQIRLRYQVRDWRNETPEQQRAPAASAEMTVRL